MLRSVRRILIAVFLAAGILLISVPTKPNASAEPALQAREAIRVLVLGRDRAANLTDSILVLSVSQDENDVRILQLPRDTYAAYAARDYRKLNGAYSVLGLTGVKQFLANAIGLPIHYALALDLDCVATLVDAVGGIDLEIPQEMVSGDPAQTPSLPFGAGMQHLNGEQAEHYVRFRSGYANADLGRMDAQKRFLRAFAEKCQALKPMELMRLIRQLLPKVETDLPMVELIRLARLLPRLTPEALPILTAPGAPVQGKSGAWYYSLNRAGMLRAVNSYLFPQSPITEAEFDPDRVFDRADMADFHNIYTAPEEALG